MSIKPEDITYKVLERTRNYALNLFKSNWRKELYVDEYGDTELWEERLHPKATPILLDTGKMYSSLYGKQTKDYLKFVVAVPYAKYHQFKYKPQNAARPMLYHSKKIDERILLSLQEVFKQWFDGSVPNANR